MAAKKKQGLGLFFLDAYLVLSAIARHEGGCSAAEAGRWLDGAGASVKRGSLYRVVEVLSEDRYLLSRRSKTDEGKFCYSYKVSAKGRKALEEAAMFLSNKR